MIRVLVVDDHSQVRRTVVEVLSEQEGLVVVGQARALRPQVVVMDFHMPEVSGL